MNADFSSEICDKMGLIFQASCEQEPEEVIASNLFKEVAQEIRQERPELSDPELLFLIIRIHSELIRRQ